MSKDKSTKDSNQLMKRIKDVEKNKSIQICKFNIGGEYVCPITGISKVWIVKDDGEGSEFPAKDIEQLIENYYEENF